MTLGSAGLQAAYKRKAASDWYSEAAKSQFVREPTRRLQRVREQNPSSRTGQ